MGDLEFLPAWYSRMLRRRRLGALLAIVTVASLAIVIFAINH